MIIFSKTKNFSEEIFTNFFKSDSLTEDRWVLVSASAFNLLQSHTSRSIWKAPETPWENESENGKQHLSVTMKSLWPHGHAEGFWGPHEPQAHMETAAYLSISSLNLNGFSYLFLDYFEKK